MMEVMVKRCAGIDVHKKTITVCTLVGSLNRSKPKKQTKEFDTTTRDLQACAQWLESLDITTVLMESTGQYWRPVWNILEPYGFKMILANAQWIAELGRCGLVSGLNVPERDIQDLRQLTRHRSSVKEDLTRRKNQVHDILQRSNIKLSRYLSDIFGATGQRLLSLFINGEVINEQLIEETISKRVHASPRQLFEAMNGSLTTINRQLLQLELATIRRLTDEIKECEQLIEEHLQPYEELYLRLLEIPGISKTTAQVVIAEVGPLRQRQTTRFVGWLMSREL